MRKRDEILRLLDLYIGTIRYERIISMSALLNSFAINDGVMLRRSDKDWLCCTTRPRGRRRINALSLIRFSIARKPRRYLRSIIIRHSTGLYAHAHRMHICAVRRLMRGYGCGECTDSGAGATATMQSLRRRSRTLGAYDARRDIRIFGLDRTLLRIV